MSYALVPNFTAPLASIDEDADRVPFHSDPILAAIDAHQEAWNVFQVAPAGEPSIQAEEAMEAAMDALLGTPCATRFGGFALLRHLRWWLAEEVDFADSYQPAYPIAQAREQDLTLFLGSDGISRIAPALPSSRPPVSVPTPRAARIVIEAGPVTAPAMVRLGRAVSLCDEVLSSFMLIGGGCALVGICTRL